MVSSCFSFSCSHGDNVVCSPAVPCMYIIFLYTYTALQKDRHTQATGHMHSARSDVCNEAVTASSSPYQSLPDVAEKPGRHTNTHTHTYTHTYTIGSFLYSGEIHSCESLTTVVDRLVIVNTAQYQGCPEM